MDLASYLPLLTAVFTFANTLVLWQVNRRSKKTHETVNGLMLHNIHEAEERGRRLERHAVRARIADESLE